MSAVLNRHQRRWLWMGAAGTIFAAVVLGVVGRTVIREWVRERPYRDTLPSPQSVDAFPRSTFSPVSRTAVSSPTPPPAAFRQPPSPAPPRPTADINLDVPFAPQAPFANWDQPYQDACEEATIIMIERYLRQAPLTLQEMDAEILRMVKLQEERYGFYRDSNAAETARVAEAFYPHLSTRVVYDITAEDIRAALAAGSPVLVLVDGQLLGNPFYTQPGPPRHTLVIKGVKGNSFITNDPGTRRGKDFVYPIDRVMRALVDYDGGTQGTGKRSMILLTRRGS